MQSQSGSQQVRKNSVRGRQSGGGCASRAWQPRPVANKEPRRGPFTGGRGAGLAHCRQPSAFSLEARVGVWEALNGGSSVLEEAVREAAEREVWTCKATLDAVTEVVLVLKIVLCGAHRVPAKCSITTERWAGAAARAARGGRGWLEALHAHPMRGHHVRLGRHSPPAPVMRGAARARVNDE